MGPWGILPDGRNRKSTGRDKLPAMDDPERLRIMLPHLAYEVWMLRSLGYYLEKQLPPDVTNLGIEPNRNALVEAFIIHARVLIEFLFFGPKSDRVGASSFLGGDRLGLSMSKTIEDLRRRANVSAAHLGWGRIEVSKLSWQFGDITRDLNKAFEEFQRRLGEPYRGTLEELLKKTQRQENAGPSPSSAGIISKPPFDSGILRTDGPMLR